MAEPGFDLSFEPETRILVMRMSGFWTMAIFARYAEALATEATRRRTTGDIAVLSDSRDFPVQSAEISAALGLLNRQAAARNAGRTAIVVGSTLNRMQAERALDTPNVRVFVGDIDAARAWLAPAAPAAIHQPAR